MERKEGYYWVKVKTGWLIMDWSEHNNSFLLDGLRYPQRHIDAEILEINENRIPSPDEVNTVFFGLYALPSGSEPIYVQLPKSATLEMLMQSLRNHPEFQREPEPIVSRVVNRNGKTWDEMTEFEKLMAKVTSIKG